MAPFFSILLAVFGLDLLTKNFIRTKLPLGAEIPVLPVFSIVHVQNTGIAFGLFQGWNYVLIGLGFVVLGFFLYYALRLLKEDRFTAFVLAMVLGGASGNLIDRVVRGQVTDFLDFYIGAHHWPAFNVADSSICVGAALLLWRAYRQKHVSNPV